MTDESRSIMDWSAFASHETVKHSRGEYARGDVHTNTIEGYFSIFKRGMKGVYVACTRFRRHRVRCFNGTGGASWSGGSSRESSSLRRFG